MWICIGIEMMIFIAIFASCHQRSCSNHYSTASSLYIVQQCRDSPIDFSLSVICYAATTAVEIKKVWEREKCCWNVHQAMWICGMCLMWDSLKTKNYFSWIWRQGKFKNCDMTFGNFRTQEKISINFLIHFRS